MPGRRRRGTIGGPTGYWIRVQGRLDSPSSNQWFGMNSHVDYEAGGSPVTTLIGRLQDQSALASVLDTLYDLGYAILSVEHLPDEVMTKPQ